MTSTKALMGAFIALALIAGIAFVGLAEQTDADGAEYAVTYNVGDKAFIVPSESATVTLSTLKDLGATAPEGVEFAAWYDGTNKYSAGSTLIITAEDKKATLTAQFKATVFEAEFLAFDGELLKKVTGVTKIVEDDGVTIIDAVPVSLPPELIGVDVSRDGYIFAGWLAFGAKEPVKTEDLGVLTEDVVYIAQYVVDYKVTFIDGDKTYVSSVADLNVPDVGERTGFDFVGWFVDGVQADPYTYVYTQDTTFVAKWQNKNCYVTFEAGDSKTVVPVLYGEKVVEPKLPAGFVAWDYDFSKPITEDITIKAIPAEPAKPTGLSDPLILSAVIIGALIGLALIAVVVMKVRKGDWVIGRAKKEDNQ